MAWQTPAQPNGVLRRLGGIKPSQLCVQRPGAEMAPSGLGTFCFSFAADTLIGPTRRLKSIPPMSRPLRLNGQIRKSHRDLPVFFQSLLLSVAVPARNRLPHGAKARRLADKRCIGRRALNRVSQGEFPTMQKKSHGLTGVCSCMFSNLDPLRAAQISKAAWSGFRQVCSPWPSCLPVVTQLENRRCLVQGQGLQARPFWMAISSPAQPLVQPQIYFTVRKTRASADRSALVTFDAAPMLRRTRLSMTTRLHRRGLLPASGVFRAAPGVPDSFAKPTNRKTKRDRPCLKRS